MPSNEGRELRRYWQNNTHTHTVTVETTESGNLVNIWSGLWLSDQSISVWTLSPVSACCIMRVCLCASALQRLTVLD